MANKPDIQYVSYYFDGSAAFQPIVFQPPKKKNAPRASKLPKPLPKIKIRIDPLAMTSILVAGIMLVLMFVGISALQDAVHQERAMANYVNSLKVEQEVLEQRYHNSYDLEDIYQDAVALGMVPIEDVEHVSISGPRARMASVAVEQEQTAWERLVELFGLVFA